MSAVRRACVALLVALGGIAPAAAGDPSPRTGGAEKKAAPEPAEADRKPRAEPLRLPADAVVVICEHAADALRLVPDAVVLSGRKYQELLDEVARLRGQLQPKKAVPPSRCQLKGRIEGRFASLQAQFDFVTDRPDAVVNLACGQAVAGNATLDGHVPLLRPDADGVSVQVDKPGEHQLVLDLLVPLGDRGPSPAPARTAEAAPGRNPARGWQGVELALPRAAVTTLELDLPAGARDVRLGGRPWADTLVVLKNNHLAGGLGPADRLDLTWRIPSAGTATLLTAEGRIRVRLDSGGLTTTAELTLRAETGQTDVWRILAPRDAAVRPLPGEEGRLKEPVHAAHAPNSPLSEYTLRLPEASAEPLTVVVSTRSPVPRPGSTVAVGPFAVEGASRQFGILQVSNAVPDLHLDYRTHGDLVYKQVPIEEDRRSEPALVAAFRYASVSATGAAVGPGINLEAETVLSQVKARVSHTLSLRPDAATGGLRWYALTTLTATPRWADVDQLKVAVPPDWEPLDETPVPADRVLTFKLPRSPSDTAPRPVTLTLEGRYRQRGAPTAGLLDGQPRGTLGARAEGGTGQLPVRPATATLALPRPLGVANQGGEITVQVPREFEVSLAGEQAEGLESTSRPTPHEQTWRGRPLPETLAIQWRPYTPDIRARSVIDLDLTPGGGEVRRQEFRCELPQPVVPQLSLRVPAAVKDLRVLSGGELQPENAGPRREDGARTVLLTLKPSSGEPVVLAYSFRLSPPGEGGKFQVPLVTLAQGAQTETRVRVWCEGGMLAVPAGPAWEHLPVEEVLDRKAWPPLVLGSPRADAPLALRWSEAPQGFTLLVDRALVQVDLVEGGRQRFKARYRLRQLTAGHVDAELPMPVALLELKATLDGKAVPAEVIDEKGRPSAAGRLARLWLQPGAVRPGSILELAYELPPHPSARVGTGPLAVSLVPPLLHDDLGAAPTCWQVTVPSSWAVLSPESGPGAERTWSWRGWLLAPRLSRSTVEAGFEGLGEAGTDADPAVVCWRGGAEPFTLTRVWHLAWLLACSLGVLVLGLGLYSLTGPGGSRGLVLGLTLLALAIAAGAVWRPTVLSAIAYGCEPGAGVLALVLLIQWLLHERYRRRVVFLPSFSRSRPGSSLLRSNAAARQVPPGEPSTVDVPRPAGSSATK
jgi:hypothetical protein